MSGQVHPEIHYHLQGLEWIELGLVLTTPDDLLIHLVPLGRLITILDEGDDHCVIYKCRGRIEAREKHTCRECQWCWYGCWRRFFPASPAVSCPQEVVNPLADVGQHVELGELILMMMLNTKLKSTNRICVYIPGESRCWRMKCSSILTLLSTDLFAQ